VTVDNAADYLAISEIDGLLVGGTSLKAQQFAEIITMAHKA
jgi:triosephosphate isomerase